VSEGPEGESREFVERAAESGKSLDSLPVAPPVAVEVPMSMLMDTPVPPDQQATPPTDFDD
jgi:hypothetical protein